MLRRRQEGNDKGTVENVMEKALVSKLVLNRKDIGGCFRYILNKCCDYGKKGIIEVRCEGKAQSAAHRSRLPRLPHD